MSDARDRIHSGRRGAYLLSDETRKARKRYCCQDCHALILVGEEHSAQSYAYDGRAYTWRSCLPCRALEATVGEWCEWPDEGFGGEDYYAWALERPDDERAVAYLTRMERADGCSCNGPDSPYRFVRMTASLPPRGSSVTIDPAVSALAEAVAALTPGARALLGTGEEVNRFRAENEVRLAAEVAEGLARAQGLKKVRLEGGEPIWAHRRRDCLGSPCPIHERTDHRMRGWPQHWRADRALMERLCPHGVGHPDPDQRRLADGGVHGCDGCCRTEGET